MPTEPDHQPTPRHDRNAALIAAARAQFQQLQQKEGSSNVGVAFTTGRAEFEHYDVVRELHRGGQGVVYLALQQGTRREVAIKMVREGPFASPRERIRFQREIEILGTLKHPNIVTIHDSGSVGGTSYYVMDYVDGPALDEFMRERRQQAQNSGSRSESRQFVRDALPLFVKLCDAVQVAHLHGVIHRDLKPSNIRIDSRGEPRVLDFGLAKSTLTPDASSEPPSLTHTGQFLGTLAYASPEQAEGAGDHLDFRTDVYSLGVMLYEMVTGHLPYSVTGPLPDVLENIRHAEPARPSSHTDVRDDLETILLKCLSKSKERRYQTAGQIGEDLRRYMDGKPIEAKRDSATYLLRMFAWQHRVAALVIVAFVALLGISSATLAYMYSQQVALREVAEQNEQRAKDNEALANDRAEETRKVAEFQASQFSGIDTALMGVRLRQALLDSARQAALAANPDEAAADRRVADVENGLAGVNFTDLATSSLEENIFSRTAKAIDDQFANQPVVQAGLLQTLAETMTELGLFEESVAPQTEALNIRRRVLGDEHPDTLDSISKMGVLLESMGRIDEAMPYDQEALDTSRRVLGDEHVVTAASVNNMCSLLVHAGRYDDAMPYCSEAIEINRRVFGDEHPNTLTALNNMGYLLKSMGRFNKAMTYFQEVLDTRRRILGNDDPQTLNSINNMGSLLKTMGRLQEAETYYKEALEGRRRVLGNLHPKTLESINGMGTILQKLGRNDEAAKCFREALDGERRILGNDHPETLITISNMGHLLHSMGRFEEARTYYQEALDTLRRVRGPEHPYTLTLMSNMGSLLMMMGRLDDAESYYREVLETSRRVFGDDNPRTLQAIQNMGSLLIKKGQLDEAMPYCQEALKGLRRAYGDEHVRTLNAIGTMGYLLQSMGRLDEAMDYRRQALDGFRRVRGNDDPRTLNSIANMGGLLQEMGRFGEAETLCLEAAAGAEKLPPRHWLHKKVAEKFVALYEAWDAAEPGKGYDRKAAQWQSRLENKQPATTSTSNP